MKTIDQIKRFLEEKSRYWHIVTAVFIILVIANYGLLSLAIPLWGCHLIAIALIILETLYITVILNYSYNKLLNFMSDRKTALFDRIESLEKHIDDLDQRNTELEKQLAHSLHDFIDKSVRKSTELISKSSESIIGRINDSARENASHAEKLNTAIGSAVQTIDSNTKKLADAATANMSQIRKLFEEQAAKNAGYNDSTLKTLEELSLLVTATGQNTDERVADALAQIIELNGNNRKAYENMASEYRQSRETAERQIQDKIAESNAAVSELIAGLDQSLTKLQAILGQDTKDIIKAVEDNTSMVTGKIDEKTAADLNLHKELVEEISACRQVLIKATGEAKQSISSDIKEAAAAIAELSNIINDNLAELGGSFNEKAAGHDAKLDLLKDKLESVSVAISQSEAAVIDSVNASKAEALDNLNAKIESVTSAIDNASSANIQRIAESEAAAIETVNASKAETIALISKNFESVTSAIDNASSANIQRIAESEAAAIETVNASKAATSHLQEKVLAELASVTEKGLAGISELASKFDELGKKTADMQLELTRLMVQLLDNQDDDSEKSQSAYNRIISQLGNFARETKSQIQTLQEFVFSNKEAIDHAATATETIGQEQLSRTTELKNNFDAFLRVTENYQKELHTRLENLHHQVLNLNSLAKVLENFSAMQMQTDQANDPNRVEEIKDAETGITVFNKYKNNKLVSSQMRDGNRITYEVEYDVQGRITRSRNYGPKGEILTELLFHPNGQVKTRIETVTIDGKKQTLKSHFDEQGNRIR